MSYDIHGDQGVYVAGGPSIGGLADLKEELAKSPNAFPQIIAFVDKGYSGNPVRLMYEFRMLAKRAKSDTVKKSCAEIAEACKKCKEVVILHNHLK